MTHTLHDFFFYSGVEVIYGDQNRSSFHNLSKLRSDETSGNGVNVYSPARAEEQMRRGNATNGTLSRMKAASEVEGTLKKPLSHEFGYGSISFGSTPIFTNNG